ncbi:hypothetical protein FALBO_10561 [Fusarium albosuccineum]|uniref:Uncharacterized protein n=1 Tax=Fusarium albosuccineum TaxID=1237068 RepID=A0A8H4L6P9_9HYPO|nr:hypothetical protein FALBO_10561 [Fusarium albosuccineum]
MTFQSPPPYPASQASNSADGMLPQYENATAGFDKASGVYSELPTFLLEDSQVRSAQSHQILYEIDPPFGHPTTQACSVTKLAYPTHNQDSIKPSRTHLYDFQNTWTSMGGVHLAINGRTSKDQAYQGLVLVQPFGTSAYQVVEHFKASQGLLDRLKGKSQIIWEDAKGKQIAIEPNSGPSSPPTLEVTAALDEKELDLLITCWCAKVWQEAGKPPREPIAWEKGEYRSRVLPSLN